MNRATIIVLALIAAFAAGTASAGYAFTQWLQLSGQQSGPWQRLSTLGQSDTDPYTRAFEHISGQLPIGGAEGQIYVASKDSDNQSLNAACNYTLQGDIPAARLFTLHAGVLLQGALHSDQLLFRGTTFAITVSATAQPDNWLALQADGAFNLVLSYYDVAVINDDTGNSTRLPRIVKGVCTNG
jgi:hypothetical protein